ncbi:leishmanolysin, GP63 [Novymonas esmeraldas]|uniref:Leishmanolysin-like peptidase n=1 Tax=Novymonas esmeraldas TaxID=1808958 RepID=A0AAW0EYB8_9TRYP
MRSARRTRGPGSFVGAGVCLVALVLVWATVAGLCASATRASHVCIHDEVERLTTEAVAASASSSGVAIAPVGLTYATVDSSATAYGGALASDGVTRDALWGPLRVIVSTEDLTDPAYHCAAVGQRVSTRTGGGVTCKEADILTDEKRDILVNYLIPQALKMHTDRLKVRQVQGRWKVTAMTDAICGSYKIPDTHKSDGVQNTDFIIYVSSVPIASLALAWAQTCQVFTNNQPVVGVINIPASNIRTRYDQYVTHTITHELAHALGFSARFFSYAGISSSLTGIRGKPYAAPVINSTTVVAKTREQFGCAAAEYMEIEDQGGSGSAGSHWKMRNAKDELMAPASGSGYYSSLTLAAFQDLGFYQADFSKAEEMPWGRNAGCAFLTGKCMENNITRWPDMFCAEDENGYRCATGRLFLGACAVRRYVPPLASYFQYFATPALAGWTNFMDYCPYSIAWTDGRCSQPSPGTDNSLYGFNVFSDAARCFDGNFTPVQRNPAVPFFAGMCVDVACDRSTQRYQIRVFGSATGYTSCKPGERVSLTDHTAAFTSGSYIICPPYLEVCQSNIQGAMDFDAISSPPTLSSRAGGASQHEPLSSSSSSRSSDASSHDSSGTSSTQSSVGTSSSGPDGQSSAGGSISSNNVERSESSSSDSSSGNISSEASSRSNNSTEAASSSSSGSSSSSSDSSSSSSSDSSSSSSSDSSSSSSDVSSSSSSDSSSSSSSDVSSSSSSDSSSSSSSDSSSSSSRSESSPRNSSEASSNSRSSYVLSSSRSSSGAVSVSSSGSGTSSAGGDKDVASSSNGGSDHEEPVEPTTTTTTTTTTSTTTTTAAPATREPSLGALPVRVGWAAPALVLLLAAML